MNIDQKMSCHQYIRILWLLSSFACNCKALPIFSNNGIILQSDLKSEEVTVEPPDEQKPEVNLAAEEAAALGIEDDTFAALEAYLQNIF